MYIFFKSSYSESKKEEKIMHNYIKYLVGAALSYAVYLETGPFTGIFCLSIWVIILGMESIIKRYGKLLDSLNERVHEIKNPGKIT